MWVMLRIGVVNVSVMDCCDFSLVWRWNVVVVYVVWVGSCVELSGD